MVGHRLYLCPKATGGGGRGCYTHLTISPMPLVATLLGQVQTLCFNPQGQKQKHLTYL